MGILAVFLAIAIPYFISGNKQRNLDQARHEVQSYFSYAHDQAKAVGSIGLVTPPTSGQKSLWLNINEPTSTGFTLTLGVTTSSGSSTIKTYQSNSEIGLAIQGPSGTVSLNGTTSNPTFVYNGMGGIALVSSATPSPTPVTLPSGVTANGYPFTLTFSITGQSNLVMSMDGATGTSVLQ